MSDELVIDKNKSDEEIYLDLLPQLKSLVNPDEPIVTNLANVSAALKDAFDKISWVGFYIKDKNQLVLGPFQGKTACTQIQIGSGVCGTSAGKKETIIVENVDEFPGHIACDAGSKSEIVVPLIKNDKVFGVLDVDSYSLASFTKVDQNYLEELVNYLCNKLNFENFVMN